MSTSRVADFAMNHSGMPIRSHGGEHRGDPLGSLTPAAELRGGIGGIELGGRSKHARRAKAPLSSAGSMLSVRVGRHQGVKRPAQGWPEALPRRQDPLPGRRRAAAVRESAGRRWASRSPGETWLAVAPTTAPKHGAIAQMDWPVVGRAQDQGIGGMLRQGLKTGAKGKAVMAGELRRKVLVL